MTESLQKADGAGNGIHELLEKRYSPTAFSSRPIEPEKLHWLFEAARSAPSSFNEQPWRFIAATREDPEAFGRLAEVLVEQNRQWARHAPLLILSVAKADFTHNGKPNRHALYDAGQAAAYLTFQATAFGLYVHQMAGFDAAKARQLLNIPEGYEPAAMIAVGYLSEPEPLPEPVRPAKVPRVRKPLESVLFGGTWGEPFPQAADSEPEGRVQ